MDSINFIYGRLFTVELLHNGYNFFNQNLLGQNINIKPDNDTHKLFTNHGMNYRFHNGSLVCFMRGRQLAPPAPAPIMSYVAFSGNIRIRFLVFSTSDFLQKTQVVAAGSTQVYQFTNQSNVGTNGFIAQSETGVNNSDLQNTSTVEAPESCFAVIDIHNNATMNVSYNLFGVDQRFLNPVYRVRFIPNP